MFHFNVSIDRCVHLTCEGDFSLVEITAAWQEVRKDLANKGWNRVLVNATSLQTNPRPAELFDLAKLFCVDFPKFGRIAIVIRWDQAGFAKSLEMLSRTVGMYLTVFVSNEQAEAWVMAGLPEQHILKEFVD